MKGVSEKNRQYQGLGAAGRMHDACHCYKSIPKHFALVVVELLLVSLSQKDYGKSSTSHIRAC